MSAQPKYFRIGLFIVVGLAVLAGGLIAFGAGQIFKPRIYIETYVNSSVQGVDRGTAVKYRGVPIGTVSDITFSFNEYGAPADESVATRPLSRYNYVVILMQIDREMFPGMFDENLTELIAKNVAQGMRARIEPLGITGMNYIDINYVKDPEDYPPLEVDWKPHYYYIPSAPGQLASILNSVNSMMADLKKLNLSKVQGGLDQLLENLNKAVVGAQLGKVSADLQSLLKNLDMALNDADLKKVSTDLQSLIAHLDKAIAEANLGAVSDDARTLMTGLQKSNAKLQKILTNLESASHFDPAEIRAIVNNLTETSANLEAFSQSVKKRPSLLLWGSPPKPKPDARQEER